MRFDHVHLRSLDPDAAGRFYVDMLGAEPAGRAETAETLRVTVKLAGVPLFIDRVPAGTPAMAPAPVLGMEHLGFAVDAIDDQIAALAAKGVTVAVQPYDIRPGLRIAFIVGPDDVRIELLQRG